MVENTASSSLFNLTGAIPLFNYLTISASQSRVLWYRTIMHILMRFHHEYRRYVTEQEIHHEVYQILGSEYTIEQCRQDLDFLRTNGNISATQDISSVNSVAEFQNRRLLYQATPEAIAIENFLDSQAHQEVRVGALDQSNLAFIHNEIKQLDEDLTDVASVEGLTNVQSIVERWDHTFKLWRTLEENAALYLNTIAQAAQQSGVNVESYLDYKNSVVQYVYRFAEALIRFGHSIRDLLYQWSTTQKKEHLIAMIARHRRAITPHIQGEELLTTFMQTARSEVEALTSWFEQDREIDMFRRRASAEVEQVVRRASSLALLRRSPLDYVTQLHQLAQVFIGVRDIEVAQHLYNAAFSTALPMHFSEAIFGPVGVADRMQPEGMWEQLPSAPLKLWIIGQRNHAERAGEEPMLDQRAKIRALKAEASVRTEKQQQHLVSLFITSSLDIGTLTFLEVDERRLLEEILDACLIDTQHQYQTQDGATITLLNKDEPTRVALNAPDGILRLPRYHLLYQKTNH